MTCIMYEQNFHQHLLGLKTRPGLSVLDLSPCAISETQTVFMSCQKVNFKKLAENETLEVDIGKVNLEALSCDTYL